MFLILATFFMFFNVFFYFAQHIEALLGLQKWINWSQWCSSFS